MCSVVWNTPVYLSQMQRCRLQWWWCSLHLQMSLWLSFFLVWLGWPEVLHKHAGRDSRWPGPAEISRRGEEAYHCKSHISHLAKWALLFTVLRAYLLLSILLDGISSMAFLPEELSCTEKRLGVLEFPTLGWSLDQREKSRFGCLVVKVNAMIILSTWLWKGGESHPYHNIAPLVDFDWKVSMWLNPFRKGGVHHCLGSRTDSDGLSQICLATSCYPGNLRGKICNVGLLLFKGILRDKHWEVDILNSKLFDLTVKECCKCE